MDPRKNKYVFPFLTDVLPGLKQTSEVWEKAEALFILSIYNICVRSDIFSLSITYSRNTRDLELEQYYKENKSITVGKRLVPNSSQSVALKLNHYHTFFIFNMFKFLNEVHIFVSHFIVIPNLLWIVTFNWYIVILLENKNHLFSWSINRSLF